MRFQARDNANRERLLGELSAHSQEVFVNNAEFLGWMQLTCVAPNGAVAEEIVAVADEYFVRETCISNPPWSSEFEITPEHRKARQTYLAIVDSAGFYDDKRVEAPAEQVQRAMRAGVSACVKRLTKEQSELVKRLQEEQQSCIEQDQKYDPRVVAHYRSMPRFPEENWDELEDEGVELDKDLEQQYATWSRELGPLLGQLPIDGGKLTPAAAEVAADGGSINSLGPLVPLPCFLSMKRIDRGLPGSTGSAAEAAATSNTHSPAPVCFSTNDTVMRSTTLDSTRSSDKQPADSHTAGALPCRRSTADSA